MARARSPSAKPDSQALGGGEGHDAPRPTAIPPRGWLAVARRLGREVIEKDLSLVAAGCAFFAFLALFPALTVMVSLYGLVLDPASVDRQLEAVREFLPPDVLLVIGGRLRDLAAAGTEPLGWGLVIGLVVALWSATAGTKALMSALNICYREVEKRGFLRFQATALGFTLAGILGVLFALTVIVGVPAVVSFDWLGPVARLALRLVSWALLAGFILVAVAVLYRYGPSRREARWRWITPGSLLVAVLWLLSSAAFSFYVANLAAYGATYGSLGAAVVLALWFYITAFVVLLGASLNAELELQTARDTTVAPEKPIGARGAYVADHVATS
jgi:membrane protein